MQSAQHIFHLKLKALTSSPITEINFPLAAEWRAIFPKSSTFFSETKIPVTFRRSADNFQSDVSHEPIASRETATLNRDCLSLLFSIEMDREG